MMMILVVPEATGVVELQEDVVRRGKKTRGLKESLNKIIIQSETQLNFFSA
jgi:hypothetical protein